MPFIVREEIPSDIPAIHAVEAAAFGREDEAVLVDSLRSESFVICSLVAEEAGALVGHILFTRLPIETSAGVIKGAALAPCPYTPQRSVEG